MLFNGGIKGKGKGQVYSLISSILLDFHIFTPWSLDLLIRVSSQLHGEPSSSIQLSATGRLLDITHMCNEYRTPLLPGQLRQPRQYDLRVTSTLQPVNR